MQTIKTEPIVVYISCTSNVVVKEVAIQILTSKTQLICAFNLVNLDKLMHHKQIDQDLKKIYLRENTFCNNRLWSIS